MRIENLKIKDIEKDGRKKTIVTSPSYETSDKEGNKSWRDLVYVRGQTWWDITNTILEEFFASRPAE